MTCSRIIFLNTKKFQQECLELLPFVAHFIDWMYDKPNISLRAIEVSDQGDEIQVIFNCSLYAGRMGAIFMTKDETGYNGFVPVITEVRLLNGRPAVYLKVLSQYFFTDFNSFLKCYQREIL